MLWVVMGTDEIQDYLCCVKMIFSHVKILMASAPKEKAEKT